MKTKAIMENTSKYIMHTYGRLPMSLTVGRDAYVWDAEGKQYLDFVSGLAVTSLGHSHPKVIKAICQQAAQLMHVSNIYHIEAQGDLAKVLVENSCADKVFFCNSGAEANEAAIKLARKYAKGQGAGDRYEIITANNSFHGRTLAAITATGQPKYHQGFEPLPTGFKYVPFNDLGAMEAAVGPHTCAILLEPIQGEGGVHPATKEYLQGVAALCKEKDLLLIFDEVQCGLGRTGKFLAYQHYGVEPDIFTLAKALANGFPIGAMLAKDSVAAAFSPGDHASTFGGNPLAATAGLTTLQVLLEDGVLDKAQQMGEYFQQRLQDLADQQPLVKEVRGVGLMLGMELHTAGQKYVDACRQEGLLINCVNNNVLRFLPPLTISKEQIDRAVDILREALENQG